MAGLYFLYLYKSESKKGIGTTPPSIAPGLAKGCLQVCKFLDGKMMDQDRKTVTKEFFVFHCLKQEGYVACCVASKEAKLRVTFGLLENVMDDTSFRMKKGYLEKKLKMYNDPDNDEISRCRTKISDIQSVMIDNMDKMFENLVEAQELDELADEMQVTAQSFKKKAYNLKLISCFTCTIMLLCVIQLICAIICVIVISGIVLVCSIGIFAAVSGGGVSVDKESVDITKLDKCQDVGALCED